MDSKKLRGLCVTCMYRKKCKEAEIYLNMIQCSEYKRHGNRKDKKNDRNKTQER